MSNARGTRWVLRGGLSAARYVPINVAVAIGQSPAPQRVVEIPDDQLDGRGHAHLTR